MSDILTAKERMLVEHAMASPLKGLVYRMAERVRVVEAERNSEVKSLRAERDAAREQMTILERQVTKAERECDEARKSDLDQCGADCDRLRVALVNAAVPLELLYGMHAIGVGPGLQAEIDSAVLGIRVALGENDDG